MRPVTAAIILSLAALAVFTVLSDGSDADGEFFTYDPETRILTITGDVPDCDITASDAPWSGYAYEVRTIVIGENVGYIGNNAFRGCTGVSTVTVIGSPTAGMDVFKGTGSTKQGFALDYKGTEIRAPPPARWRAGPAPA